MASPVSDPVVPSSRPQPPLPSGDGDGHGHGHRRQVVIGILALVALIAVVVVAAFALKSDPTARSERVLLVGDSITDQSRTGFTGALPSEDTVDIQAVPGRKFAEMLPFATQAAQFRPEQVVINLGSNDVLLGEADATTDPAMDAMFGLFAGTPCVTVVTVNEHFAFGYDQGSARAPDQRPDPHGGGGPRVVGRGLEQDGRGLRRRRGPAGEDHGRLRPPVRDRQDHAHRCRARQREPVPGASGRSGRAEPRLLGCPAYSKHSAEEADA